MCVKTISDLFVTILSYMRSETAHSIHMLWIVRWVLIWLHWYFNLWKTCGTNSNKKGIDRL
jgi:hypothetical protein